MATVRLDQPLIVMKPLFDRYHARRAGSRIRGWRSRAVGGWVLAMTLVLAGCPDVTEGPPLEAEALPTTPAPPRVTGVTHVPPRRLDVAFSRPMAPTPTASAVRLYRLTDHAWGDVAAAGVSIPVETVWTTEDRLRIGWRPDAGRNADGAGETLVLVIESTARDPSGRRLDGRAPGIAAGLHRPDDDGARGAASYRSAPLNLGRRGPFHASVEAGSAMVVTGISVWHGKNPGGARDASDGLRQFEFGASRVGAFPAVAENASFRIRFAAPGGRPYDLVSPGAIADQIRILTDNGNRLRSQVGLAQLPGVEWAAGARPVVADAGGRAVTSDIGPGRDLTGTGQLRKADEPVWMLVGDRLPPAGLLARVEDYDGGNRSYRLAAEPIPVTARVWGVTATTERLWLDGELAGGYSLRLTDGATVPIRTATGETLHLAATAPAGPCEPCAVLIERVEERIQAGESITVSGRSWYLHPDPTVWPTGRLLFLSVNPGNTVVSVVGTPMRDDERDGDERSDPPAVDDEFVMQFGLRSASSPLPPVSRLHDGFLYPTLFETRDTPCLGGHQGAVCVLPLEGGCQGSTVPAEAQITIATSDGRGSQPEGESDLIETERIDPDAVTLLDGTTGRPLEGTLGSRIRLNQTGTGFGTLPTTVLVYRLLAGDDSRSCPEDRQRRLLRGFRDGDRLIVSHRIRPVVPSDPRTIDGDGDGIASASARDDWVGVYDAARAVFAPLERHPRP